MPKILINEVDETSAGTPGRYGNYSVLITGYQKQYTSDEIEAANTAIAEYKKIAAAIANGDNSKELPVLSDIAKVIKARDEKAITKGSYEFNSINDFKEVTGYDEVSITRDEAITKYKSALVDGKKVVEECHYGSRMAYELLKLGYQVVYKVIDKVHDMIDFDKCWVDFKDKATYDFRFISHGLLNTEYDATSYAKWVTQREAMKSDLELLRAIEKEVKVTGEEEFTVQDLIDCDNKFSQKVAEAANAGKTGFGHFSEKIVIDKEGKYVDGIYTTAYTTYHVAAGFVLPENLPEDFKDLTDEQKKLACTPNETAGINGELLDVEANIKSADENSVTIGIFNTINGNIAALASYRDAVKEEERGRGDCVALIEVDENIYTAQTADKPEARIIKGINVLSTDVGENGAYCALTVPSVVYANGMKLPGAFHYLACFMSSLNSGFSEWYAAAGYNRGTSSYAIDHTTVKLGEIAIGALEPRYKVQDPNKLQPQFACNVIANFRGSYYLWGNRTAAKLLDEAGGGDLTASHFLNIRQLCSTIKKQLYVSCRRFTFDPNSDTLWFNFVNSITPTLDAMKADQGIRDYRVVKVATDKKATLKARIRIIPIEAVEDFDLTVSLEDSFGGVSVTAEG